MKRHPTIAFFALMFVFSWGVWIPLARYGFKLSPMAAERWQMIGGFGPCLAAIIVTAACHGQEGLRRLFRQLLIWRVGVPWYLAALFLPAAISLLTTALHTMLGGDAPNFADPPIYHVQIPSFYTELNAWTMLVPFFLQSLLAGSALGEEMGWRGFALPHLQQRFSALGTSVILAVGWTVWMVPLLARQSALGYAMSLASVVLTVIPGAILSTWIYNNTCGSLLLLVLFNHTAKVTDAFLTPAAARPIITVISMWAVTLAVVAWSGPQNLSRRSLGENCRR